MASAFPRERITPITVVPTGLTTSVTAYTSGDVVGAQMQFKLGDGAGPAYGEIENVVIIDKANVLGAVELWLFSAAVTPAADNAAVSFSDADLASLVQIFPVANVYAQANGKVIIMDPAEDRPVQTGAGGILYGSLVTRTGNSFFSAQGDVIVTMHYEPTY